MMNSSGVGVFIGGDMKVSPRRAAACRHCHLCVIAQSVHPAHLSEPGSWLTHTHTHKPTHIHKHTHTHTCTLSLVSSRPLSFSSPFPCLDGKMTLIVEQTSLLD